MDLLNFLPEMDKGRVLAEINEALTQGHLAAAEHGKSAKIKIEFTVNEGQTADEVEIGCKITKTIPAAKRRPSFFFKDEEGKLHRDNPKQAELQLEEGKVIPMTGKNLAAS